jgi:hypothetical protein
MVVDGCCAEGGTNLPAALLDHLGIRTIDALVLTHPDLDHVRGVADVVRRFQPAHVFRYPNIADLRELVGCWLQKVPGNKLFREIADALDVIELQAHRNARHRFPCATCRPWRPQGAPYTVHFLAPTPFDMERVSVFLKKLVQYDKNLDSFRIPRRIERILRGEIRLRSMPNVLSLALVLEWSSRKVLLAGDVENGTASQESGWKGVLRVLDDPNDGDGQRGHLVEDVDLVKVAHHGSKGAFFTGAWVRHAKSRKTTALIAPHASSSLPSDPTLIDLRAYCQNLGISAEGGRAFARAQAAGWNPSQAVQPTTVAPCLAAVLDPAGGLQLFRGSCAGLFQ